ncbi:MAG: sigma 54-interacting transcriptional regulator [Vicinamibacterales bacterium]
MASPIAARVATDEAVARLDPEARRAVMLLDVNRALGAAPDLRAGVRGVLELLAREYDALRCAVVLRTADGGTLTEVAGHAARPGVRTKVRGHSAVVERVLETGRAIMLPSGGGETGPDRREDVAPDVTHISVPVALTGGPLGVLSLDLPSVRGAERERLCRALEVVGSMLGQATRVEQMAGAERERLVQENEQLHQQLRERYNFANIVGTSGPIRRVYELMGQVAASNTTVLLRGESGTGKELIARAIHYSSPRARHPFVTVSCGALPESLIESELFGYERGAFTGATGAKKGRFELARGGTLFLDEVGELNLATQVKLLRALQAREFEPLGGTEPVRMDVRVIAATHRNLEQGIAAGSFREDLYYRLNVFSIFVPPLRERKPDLLQLADHFLEKFAREHSKVVKRISTPAIDMLMSYHWPGNVRELSNVIERAVVVCDSQVVHAHHLPPTLQTADASGTTNRMALEDAVGAYEKDLLLDALKSTGGVRSKAARLLQTTERIFNYKVRKYGIDWRRFRM